MGVKVITDTREQKPLIFSDAFIEDVIVKKLDTGDYSVEGLEDKLFIERKSSLVEFYKNVTEKRFWNELDRTSTFKYKFLVVEFDLEDVAMFPHGCGLPKAVISKLRVKSSFILKSIADIMIKYNINFIFATNSQNCTRIVERIIKSVCEKESD